MMKVNEKKMVDYLQTFYDECIFDRDDKYAFCELMGFASHLMRDSGKDVALHKGHIVVRDRLQHGK